MSRTATAAPTRNGNHVAAAASLRGRSGETAAPVIRSTLKGLRVTPRWLSLDSEDFQRELSALASRGREASRPLPVRAAIAAAVRSLDALRRGTSR